MAGGAYRLTPGMPHAWDGTDVSSREVLRQLVMDVGLDEAEVDVWLKSGRDVDAVNEEALKKRRMISEVPTFVIQRIHRVDEAQEAQDFLDLFIEVNEGE